MMGLSSLLLVAVSPALVRGSLSEDSSSTVETSMNGLLEVVLTLTTRRLSFPDGSSYTARCYNGMVPGPHLQVRPGDVLRIRLINALARGGGATALNTFRQPNVTNLHLHGMHVSPVSPADDVTVAVLPGQQFDYEYHIPLDHAPGVHWYHPHFHGSAALQTFGGASGVIEVLGYEGVVASLPTFVVPVQFLQWDGSLSYGLSSYGIREIQYASGDRLVEVDTHPPQHDFFLVDGGVVPIYRLYRCHTVRFRFVFASSGSRLLLDTSSPPDCDQCTMMLLGRDGHLLGRHPRRVQGPVFVPAGGRVDVSVRCPKECRYNITTGGVTLAELDVQPASACQSPLAEESLTPPHTCPYTKDLRHAKVRANGKFTLRLVDGKGCRYASESPVVGKKDGWYQMERDADTRHVAQLRQVQEATLTDSLNHPFHIHVAPFQIMPGGVTIAAPGNFEPGDWADTVQFTNFTFRFRPRDFTGQVMFHCHVLSHEDQGCMAQLEVLPTISPSSPWSSLSLTPSSVAAHLVFPLFLILGTALVITCWADSLKDPATDQYYKQL